MRFLLVWLVLTCAQVSAQVVLRIYDAPAVNITAESMAKLARQSAVVSEHGKQVSFEGVLLHDVLAQAGLDFGKGLHGKQLSSYAVATGSDDYRVVYSLAELDPTLEDSGILIADKREGQPLGASEGPLRIVVPHDKRPARSLRMLHEIDVVELSR